MNPRQHIVALIIGGVLLVMFLVMGFFLYRKMMEYRQASSTLGGALARQQQLFDRQPFPSPENIEREEENRAQIEQEFQKLLALLSEAQIEPVDQKPAAFSTQFWEVRRELLAQALERKIAVPPEFAFGFQRHMGGDLAPHPDVPRLTQQLMIVESLCKVLYAAKIDELKSVIREEFEGSAGAAVETAEAPPERTGRRGARSAAPTPALADNPVVKEAGLIPEGQLFGKMHFAFRFTARESVVFTILNHLAQHPMLVGVTRVDLASDDPAGSRAPAAVATVEVPPPGQEEGDGGVTNAPIPIPAADPMDRDQRIRYGREPRLMVTLEVDVYRFRKDDNGKRS